MREAGNGLIFFLAPGAKSASGFVCRSGSDDNALAIEVWGRGTNRVIEACRAYGIAEPTITEVSGVVTVTFKAEVVAGAKSLVPDGH